MWVFLVAAYQNIWQAASSRSELRGQNSWRKLGDETYKWEHADSTLRSDYFYKLKCWLSDWETIRICLCSSSVSSLFVHCSDFSSHFLLSHHYCPFPSVPLSLPLLPLPSLCFSLLFPPTPLGREAFDAGLISIHAGHSSAPCRSLSSEQEARSIRWLNGWIS